MSATIGGASAGAVLGALTAKDLTSRPEVIGRELVGSLVGGLLGAILGSP